MNGFIDLSSDRRRLLCEQAQAKVGLVLSILRWPLSFLIVGNGYSPGKVVDNIAPVPLLLIHGTADRVIPFHHGKELYEKAGEPKEFWVIKNGRHTEAFTTYGRQYREALVKFYKDAP